MYYDAVFYCPTLIIELLKEWSDEKKKIINFSYLIELTKIYKSVLFIFFKNYFFLAKFKL